MAHDTAPAEEWRPVAGWEGKYLVSDLGRVQSVRRVIVRKDGRQFTIPNRVLKPLEPGKGPKAYPYYTVRLVDRTVDTDLDHKVAIHRLVTRAFLGPRPSGLVICHGPGGQLDNRLCNLRYDTQRENMLDVGRHAALEVDPAERAPAPSIATTPGRGREPGTRTESHCSFGHPLTPPNLDPYHLRKSNCRMCRACLLAKKRLGAGSKPSAARPFSVLADEIFNDLMTVA